MNNVSSRFLSSKSFFKSCLTSSPLQISNTLWSILAISFTNAVLPLIRLLLTLYHNSSNHAVYSSQWQNSVSPLSFLYSPTFEFGSSLCWPSWNFSYATAFLLYSDIIFLKCEVYSCFSNLCVSIILVDDNCVSIFLKILR